MNRKISSIILFFLLVPITAIYAQNVSAKKISFRQLQERMETTSVDTILVINFWATWCKPCIEEMPVLEEIPTIYKGTAVKVLLVSLDFTDQIEQKVRPFIKKNRIVNEVVVLDESNPNDWIPKVDPQWSGAIPACLFQYKTMSLFHEGKVTPATIQSSMNQLMP